MRRTSHIGPICPISPISSIGPIGLILLVCLLLTGCESDSIEPANEPEQTTMELMSFSSSFLDVKPWFTRSNDIDFHFSSGYQTNHLPNGYESYEQLHPHASVAQSTIGVFMTPESANPTGDFIYQGIENGVSVWKSTIVVEKDMQYYIYGFMPRSGAESATITSLNGTGGDDFANGAIINIDNYDALTTADVSVIVGLRWATADEKINGINQATGSDVPLGHFSYVGMEDGENRLFVLLKHVYAGLHFATKLDATYAGLRSIRITKVELTAQGIKEKINLRLRLEANSTGTDPLTSIEYIPVSNAATDKTITLYEKDEQDATDLGVDVPVADYEDFLGCLVPGSTERFLLRTTYDVYDRNVTTEHPEGNLIRKGCVAENQINRNSIPTFPELLAGELFTVKLNIKPTFLYMLSEPDLNNPTITIE